MDGISYMADRVFIHRWPHDTPEWDGAARSRIEHIIKKPGKKAVTARGKTVTIEGVEFSSLKKLGVSVPFFKRDCRMIFESQFGGLYAHVHVITSGDDYLEVFGRLARWERRLSE